MENNSIREFTCNDCHEVTKVDWSKVRPDIDDGTSNIYIQPDGNDYKYVGECENCGNLVEIEPPVPELVVDNVDVDKNGMFIQVTDKVTNRSCWIEAWKSADNDDWDWDFNQYIFHLDDDSDVIAKMFQEDLGNYGEELGGLVLDTIYEHEDEYNKLQENKAPTMRDRLKEAKAGTVSIKAYGKVYYEFSEEEWNSKSEEEKEATIADTADQATEEEGHTVYEDEVEVITESKEVKTESKEDLDKSSKEKYKQVVVTFECDDCGHKEDWTFDDMAEWRLAYLEASDSNNEVGDCPNCGSMYYNMKDYKIIEENKEVKTETLHANQKEKLSDGTTRIKLVDDGHEQWFIVKSVKDNGVIDYDYDHNVEQSDEDRDYFDSSVDVNDVEEILLKVMKENKEVKTESNNEVVYYNILHGEDNKYTLLVKTSKRLKGKESDTDDTVLMKLIDALEEKELIDLDTGEDLEFGKLKIEWNNIAEDLIQKGFTCYDLTKYKFEESKEVKTENKDIIRDYEDKIKSAKDEKEFSRILKELAKDDKNVNDKDFDDIINNIAIPKALKEFGMKVNDDESSYEILFRSYIDNRIYESAPVDVIEYFGMQDNTDEAFKDNVAKEYKTLRAKYPDKEMILNGDFGTYLGTEKVEPIEKGEYITVYDKVEESKKEEAKFKDKVKAIKKSLKKNDKRLSDKTAEKSAEKIAGSMIKKEDKTIKTENILDDVREYDVKLYDDVIELLNYYFDDMGTPEDETGDIEDIVTEIQSKFAFDHHEAVDIVDTFIKEYKAKLSGAEKTNLSKEDVKNLLDNGNIIKVGGKMGTTPTKYLERDGKLYFLNEEITWGVFLPHPKGIDETIDYIVNLQKDGFTLTSEDWNDTVKIEECKEVKTEDVDDEPLKGKDVLYVFEDFDTGVDKEQRNLIKFANDELKLGYLCSDEGRFTTADENDIWNTLQHLTGKEVERLIRLCYGDEIADKFEIFLDNSLETLDTSKIKYIAECDTSDNKKVTESKTSDMDTVDIVMELEGGELTIKDVDDWNKVKSIANDLKGSQGFYGRLLASMLDAEEEFGGVENLPFPITM